MGACDLTGSTGLIVKSTEGKSTEVNFVEVGPLRK